MDPELPKDTKKQETISKSNVVDKNDSLDQKFTLNINSKSDQKNEKFDPIQGEELINLVSKKAQNTELNKIK